MPDRSFVLDALVGASVATLLAFLPFSALLGGGVAGYLHGHTGALAGALAGAFAAVPKAVLVLVALAAIGLVSTGTAALLVDAFVRLLAALVVYAAALGALGGYLGAYLARTPRTPTSRSD